MRIVLPIIAFSLLLLSSCDKDDYVSLSSEATAFTPIYIDSLDLIKEFVPDYNYTPPIKQHWTDSNDSLLFSIIGDSGLYLRSKSDPNKSFGYYRIPNINKIHLNQDSLTIETNIGFIHFRITDHTTLKYTNITQTSKLNFQNLTLLRKLTQRVGPVIIVLWPTSSIVRFNCPEKSKGFVIDWEMATINKPKCFF